MSEMTGTSQKRARNESETSQKRARNDRGGDTDAPAGKRLEYKIFNDPIHGHVEVHPLCVAVIDTPHFQRLRHIKQLGGGYLVFPGASHNRFEHSIGVCHLAGELIKSIKYRQPELAISESDILCVQIAGLCHDLGHGPFSHLFDMEFIPKVSTNIEWKHEDASMAMFDHMIEENNLGEQFTKYRLDDNDKLFIKELIIGINENDEYKGRPKDKRFLYEIVANKTNGIDVDKWDYFRRDCHHLGISSNFDHTRLIKFARVISVGGKMRICYRDKQFGDVHDMFYTRSVLHRRAYQHKTVTIIQFMISEAMVKADGHILGDGRKMSECLDNMAAYTQLTDHIYHTILYSTHPQLQESRAIIERIERRDLYGFVGQSRPLQGDIKERIPGIAKEIANKAGPDVVSDSNIIVIPVKINYGAGSKNPLDNVNFYSKNTPNEAEPIPNDERSDMLPKHFVDSFVRVYSRKSDAKSINQLKICFNEWCKEWSN